MTDYRSMAINSILNRSDLTDWIADLSDTCQYELAEDLVDIVAGLVLPDAKVYRLWGYMLHVESVGNGN